MSARRLVLLATLSTALLIPASAGADTVSVNSPDDGAIVGCNLREAIDSLDSGTEVDDCVIVVAGGTNTVTFTPDMSGSTITLRLFDAWAGGEPLWSKELATGTRGTIIDGEEFAVLEPGGLFTVVSMTGGEVQFAAPLVPERQLAAIQVVHSREQYILVTSQENPPAIPGTIVQGIGMGGAQQTRVHGYAYAFDRRTGKVIRAKLPESAGLNCGQEVAHQPLVV